MTLTNSTNERSVVPATGSGAVIDLTGTAHQAPKRTDADMQRRLQQLETRRASQSSNDEQSSPARPAKQTMHRWARWLHVYTSMVALVIVLFFGATGIMLNHPSWAFGDATSRTTTTGVLTVDPTFDDGTIDWLTVAEHVRADYNITGSVSDFGLTGTEARIQFENPGYSANLFFDATDANFDLIVEQQGFLAVMGELHKGSDTGSAWKWVIDVAAGFLVAISLTGLAMQFFMRKRRRSALTTAAIGGVISAGLIWLTIL